MAKSKKIKDPNKLFFRGAIKGEDAENFAFHEDSIIKCLNSLGADETSSIVFGERGVGKTSFAWQALSVLEDINAKYTKEELMVVGLEKEYKCVFFKCRPQIHNLYDLLLHILKPSPDRYSLSTVFSELYEDSDLNFKIKGKFKFDLFSILNVEIGVEKDDSRKPKISHEETYTILTSEQKILALFEEVVSEIYTKYPNIELVFFIDEMEQLVSTEGVGAFLKNLNYSKFCFVGIANNISEIISDHKSAGRKLIGGDVEVQSLAENQIDWIFTRAEDRSQNGVEFSEEFRKNAIEYCAGFPWIAQNLGYQAVYLNLLKGSPPDETISVKRKDFKKALNEVISIYKREYGVEFDLNAATDAIIKVQILEFLWNCKHYPSEDQIRDHAEENGRLVQTALKRLHESGVIQITTNKTWRYLDPIIRILVRFHLDNLNLPEQ